MQQTLMAIQLASIASVDSVVLTEIETCETVGVKATVTNTEEEPVEGVRVDFTVTGDSATTGFAFTDELGEAEFCYDSVGTDTVVANVGAVESNELELTFAVNEAPNDPTELGSVGLVDGSETMDTTPTFNFTLSDPNEDDEVQFVIEIDDSADFNTLLVSYVSVLAAQGEASFTVGQVAGDGTYSVGTAGQTLEVGDYYWRVKAIDELEEESDYSTANDGEIAFSVIEEELEEEEEEYSTGGGGTLKRAKKSANKKADSDESADSDSGDTPGGNSSGDSATSDTSEAYKKFEDLANIPATDWRAVAISQVIEFNLFSGKDMDGVTFFDPQGQLTRAEAAKITCLLINCLESGHLEGDFYDDVAKGDWYYDYVVALSHVGVLQGRAPSEYMPNEVVTRAEFVKMLTLGLAVQKISFKENWSVFKENISSYETNFNDAEFKIESWFNPFVFYMESLGYLSGYIVDDKQYFYPDNLITRAEAAALLVRVIKLNKKTNYNEVIDDSSKI